MTLALPDYQFTKYYAIMFGKGGNTVENKNEKDNPVKKRKRDGASKEERINRRINFLVMRQMWQYIRGRAHKNCKEENIYNTLSITRQRFERAIDGSSILLSREELITLSQKTGLSADIFTGKKSFNFQNISMDEWRALYKKETPENPVLKEQYSSMLIKLKEENRGEQADEQFFKLCYYLEQHTPSPKEPVESLINKIKIDIGKISFDKLDRCESNVLSAYVRTLKSHYNMVSAIANYKIARAGIKEKSAKAKT